MAIGTDGTVSGGQKTYTDKAIAPKLPKKGGGGGGGTGGTGGGGGGSSPQYTSDQLDAKGIIDGFLGQYGLKSLADWAWGRFLAGVPVSEIMVELRSRPEYKARFPAMDSLAQKGRAMSEAEYVAYERQAAGLFRMAGLPAGFYDSPQDFSKLIAGEVSINELSTRVQTAYNAVATAPQAVRDAFAAYYGPRSDQALAAYMLDPDRALTLIEQQIGAAQFTGIGSRFNFQLTQSQAEDLGREGFSSEQITSGYQQADQLRSLADENLAEGMRGQDITQEDVLMSSFGRQTDEPLRRRVQERAAAFSAGGSANQSQSRAYGLGGSQKG